ncbi:oligoendopeptidase F [Fusibacter ferrireducens]|uniref:Oligopeptidase F n=1 Tax=Fusibacter ferrireducens TaxID=2785058 RepID=A0ABR9ZZ35_9FIRM|nr:oligoendopeptidase F [Fusibacter ferrireducens]MBF4695714.1 oligoendopeptidase F [Fusibacter ferrireducens]
MKHMKHTKYLISFLLITMILFSQSFSFALDIPTREDVSDAYKWDLTDLYSDRSAFEKDVKLLNDEYIPKLATYEGKLSTAENIIAYFELDIETSTILTNVYMYPYLIMDLNQDSSEATEMAGMADSTYGAYQSATAFAIPEILKLDESVIQDFMALPEMAPYNMTLDKLIKSKAHVLSSDEEKILALASETTSSPKDIYDKVTLADYVKPEILDSEGQKLVLNSSTYYDIIESNDRALREKAYHAKYASYEAIINTIAATMNAEVKKNIFLSKARGYNSALEASLDAEYIPKSIYDNLVNSVNKNLSYLHKYYTVRKKAMGLDELHSYDCYVPLVDNFDFEMSYDDAVKTIETALAPLGDDYIKTFDDGIKSNWLDVYEDDHKYTGGYNWGNYSTHPYILLNYDNSLDAVSTLAHEMGHAINSVYSDRAQNYLNADYPIFTAEVASTANEILLMDYLIKNAKSDDERLYLLNMQINNIRGTVYTQVMFAEFEQTIHEKVESGEALSADYLNNLWLELLHKYYGPDYTVDDVSKTGWSTIPHFYMNFYVYKYATSMSAANEIVNNIIENKPQAIEKYLTFLAAGGSDYPVDILKKAGVDMTASAPVDNLLTYFGELVDTFEATLEKKIASPQTITYTVKANDALWKIAAQYHTTIDVLLKLNQLNDKDLIIVGQKILVPAQ